MSMGTKIRFQIHTPLTLHIEFNAQTMIAYMYACLISVLLTWFLQRGSCSFGPPYPVTGAWFRSRSTSGDWNATLHEFSEQGGNTVVLRAPLFQFVDRDELLSNPDYQWCYSRHEDGNTSHCVDDALALLQSRGGHVTHLATYGPEENFNTSQMLVCPDYDVMIVSDRIYYRIVIPQDLNTNCNYSGVDVIVVFVAFSGVDSQELLLPVAQGYNMSVHFGLPRLSMTVLSVPNKDPVLLSYLLFVQRIIQSNNKKFKQYPLVGYFWSDDVMLPDVNKPSALQTNYGKLLSELHLLLHENHKTFGLTSLVNTNKLLSGIPSTDHVKAFSTLARFCDIISVKDGQGSGTSGLFWVTQRSQVISKADPGLFAVLREQLPVLSTNTTYEQVFWNSISEVFDALADARDALQNKSVSVDLWLNIEVYDVLHTDPCLPVDEQASGLDRMLNPIKKSRVDSVLTAAGTAPQKVVAMAWDPSFTCVTDSQPAPLRTQVRADMGRPVIAHCSMHSSFNRSVVVIGYNLDGLQQMYTIDWPNANGQRTKSNVYGYYFELDWGSQHQRVPSLMYVQTFDPYDVTKLAPRGVVRVQAGNSYHACVFEYDFTKADDDNRLQKHESRVAKKKYVRVKNEPYRRIEAQDSKF